MFLRAHKRFKDGKTHRYWSVVENRRVAGGRCVQKTLLYLGEINDRASWTRAIDAVDERDQTCQIHLFPEDRTPDPLLEHPMLKLRLDQMCRAYPFVRYLATKDWRQVKDDVHVKLLNRDGELYVLTRNRASSVCLLIASRLGT